METNIDMNSNRVINLGSPQGANDAARWVDVTGAVDVTGLVAPSQSGNSGRYLGTDGSVASWSNPPARFERTTAEISAGITPTNYSFEEYDVRRYGAVGDGVANDAIAIQTAINLAISSRGGVVTLQAAAYNLGTTGLTLDQNVTLKGTVQQYAAATTRGTRLIYGGTGTAVYGLQLLNTFVEDLSIDASTSTGTAVIGVHFNGAWLSGIRRVRINGVTRAKGYGILVDTYTAGGPWGAQHNYFEHVEVPDGVIRMAGPSASDGVTTTVLNTVRGFQYEFVNAQGVAINCTAEGWTTGAGFAFNDSGTDLVMVGCDIEGSGSPGISIGGGARVREIGTVWQGFSGTTRVSGEMDTLRTYGGALEYIREMTAGTPVTLARASNAQVNGLVSQAVHPVNVGGGTQDAYWTLSRFVAGSERLTHELRYHAVRQHSKSVANTATSVFTVAIPSSAGVSVECTAWGVETGVSAFAHSCDITAANNGGTVTTPVVGNVNESPAGSGAVFTAVASGGNLEIRFAHGSATATSITFLFVVRGAFTNLTLN
jgi:hypothetical protein